MFDYTQEELYDWKLRGMNSNPTLTLDGRLENVTGIKKIIIGNLVIGKYYKMPWEVKRADGTTLYIANPSLLNQQYASEQEMDELEREFRETPVCDEPVESDCDE